MPNLQSATEMDISPRRRLLAAAALALAALAAPAAQAHGDHGAAPAATPAAARPELGTSVAFAPDGSLHAVGVEGGHVLLYRSDDGGGHWQTRGVVNREPERISADGENRPKLAFMPDGAALVSWTKPLAKPYSGEIRFARAADGEHFDAPITVHRNRDEITHRFDSLAVSGSGQVLVSWIDKRDLEAARRKQGTKADYRGAAVYAAVSTDGGRSFRPEVKLADHSCECCRIAIANDVDGVPVVLWRHVFGTNERDHALTRFDAAGKPGAVVRATFDRWHIDACPHHGPSLAIAGDGTRHAVWFNAREGEPRVFYGRLTGDAVEGQRSVGGERAAHADIAVAGRDVVAIVWKEFDGTRTQLRVELSTDGGRQFGEARTLAATEGASDQPRLVRNGDRLLAFWRTEREGMRGYALP
ncbi:conserved hypothetical secreted protein [Azoarcus olearius]|uniref:Conserved hypothetical secreted protein n=2 Tax=Azoarcus sp. (strain BH72) TaxID=418699 RepID=A1K7G7_AZOSB|nr:conserved hypothetical secreted protein [Azoarcus olearius]